VDDGASASGSGSDSGSDGDDSDAVWESEDDSESDDDSDGSDGSSNHTSDVEPSGADAGLPDAGAMREVCGADAARPDALPDAGATCEAGASNGDVRLVQPPPLAPRRAGAVDEAWRDARGTGTLTVRMHTWVAARRCARTDARTRYVRTWDSSELAKDGLSTPVRKKRERYCSTAQMSKGERYCSTVQ
jgi:hypothetical protein